MMHYQNRTVRGKRCGFTLVEVLIALVIFAIVITSGFACVKMGLNFVDNSRHHTRASQMMQSEIERMRSLAWAGVTALPRTESSIAVSDEFSEGHYSKYDLKRTISGSGDVRKITLIVSWSDLSGKVHSKTYVTQYTKGGLYDYIQ